MRHAHATCARGFTLLEVLIASVLLGTVFVAVVGLLSQSLRNIDRMKPHERALLHARDRMSELLVREELRAGDTAGEWDDGYRWQARVTPLASEEQVLQGNSELFRVRVEVRWGQGQFEKTYAVETIQLARKAPPETAR